VYISWILLVLRASNEAVYAFVIVSKIFNPLQGFGNLIVFIWPRYRRQRSRIPNESRFHLLKSVIFEVPLVRRRTLEIESVNASIRRQLAQATESDGPENDEDDRITPASMSGELRNVEGTLDEDRRNDDELAGDNDTSRFAARCVAPMMLPRR
jgi:hypothetical protein